ncbi:MAG: DsbA family protein [Immundisolibacteraceae bacterium]|nr:DsbA family protein [Immundisolibacteraceae bacterium]
MAEPVKIKLFYNFRSPYCYLATRSMFRLIDNYNAEFEWRALGGWSGRSSPERAAKKIHIARQDGKRWADRLGIPFVPPPKTTDPTRAGAGSLLAEERGRLREYILLVMQAEWTQGKDIGDLDVLLGAGTQAGLDRDELAAAVDDPVRLKVLDDNWAHAEELGAYGVPIFMIGEEIFWGNDRIEFAEERLVDLGANLKPPL